MAVGYIPLPAYRAGGQLDFSGLNQGLDELGRSIEKNRLLAEQKEIGKALQSGGQGQPTATSSSQPQYGKQNALLPNYASSIAGIETGSFKEPYTAQGPVVKSGDRAYGKYQVMGSNIGPWTREILGQEMTPAQFLTSPEAQEKVFAAKFGSYVQQTGNPQDAASMWFTGRPAAEGADRRARDANGNPLGITGREYVEKFSAGLGQPSPQGSRNIPAAPQQGGMNYANAANVAFGQGNLDIGMQLANAQRAEQEAAYNRQRQATADQRAEEEYEAALVKRIAGVAQTVRNEADPQRKAVMVRNLMQVHPRLRQTLSQYGFDPRNPDPTMDMIIAEARGVPQKNDFMKVGPGDVVVDPRTGQPVYTAAPKPQTPSATAMKEVFEADEAAQASSNVLQSLDKALELNQIAYSGPAAQTRGYISSLFGADGGTATEELQNVVTQQVLENLKATFGGMPTEGERQILLEVQGSVNKAPNVRKGIFERAQAAARKRLEFSKAKSEGIRSGEYFQPGYSPQQQAAPQAQPAAPSEPQPGQLARPRARNPQTGEEIEFNEQTGQWEPVQ